MDTGKRTLAILKRIVFSPAAILALVTFLVFFTTIVVRIRTFYVFQDNIDQFYAWYQKLAYAVHGGTLPIWDANVSSGHSFVGELQAGVFYPVNLLWVWLFGSAKGISVYWLELIVVFHFWLASMGMYMAGRAFGLRKVSALIAGLAFAFGGGVAVRSVAQTAIFFGIAYIPWAVYMFVRWTQTGRKLYLLGCSIALGFIIMAGHIDPWYFACLLIAFSILFRPLNPNFQPVLKTILRQGIGFAIAAAVSLIVALPQVALSAQYLPQAVRFVGDAQPIQPGQQVSLGTFTVTYSFKPQDFLSLLDPVKYPVTDGNELYIDLTGLAVVLAVVLLFRKQLRDNAVWKLRRSFLLGTMGVATVVMLGYWTFIPAVLRYLPLFSQVRQLARYSVLVQFCLALLLGICVEVLATNAVPYFKERKRKLVGFVGGAALTGFLGLNTIYLFLVARRSAAIDKHFVYQSAILALVVGACVLYRKKLAYIVLAGMILSTIVQPVWFMPRINDFKPMYPPNYYRATPAITYLEQFYGQARVEIVNNAIPVNIGDVYNIQTTNGYGATLHENYYKFLNEPDAANDPAQHLNLLNVRFVVAKTPQPGLKAVLTDNIRHVTVYERPRYVPRAYFASQLNACENHLPGCTPISITAYNDNSIKLHYNLSTSQKLVLAEINYTGWKAYVDNKSVPITAYGPTATQLFRSVSAPAGSHDVEFRYQPFGL